MRQDRNRQLKGVVREDRGPEHSLGITQHLETEQKGGSRSRQLNERKPGKYSAPEAKGRKAFQKNGLTDLSEWC